MKERESERMREGVRKERNERVKERESERMREGGSKEGKKRE